MALVVKTETSGRAGCGAFACRAGNIPLDCRPGALGACVDVDKVFSLIDKDEITGVAAVALCLLVHSIDISHSAVRTDLVTADGGIGCNRSISLYIVHCGSIIEPALCGALIAVFHAEIAKLAADFDEALGHTAVLGGIKIEESRADLAVAGQDLAAALAALITACVISGTPEFEEARGQFAVCVKAVLSAFPFT